MEESSVEHGLKRSLEVGTEVEVSFDVLGLKGSWYEGTIVRCVPKKNRVTVEYRNLFRNLKGTRPVREILNYSMIRPRPPTVKEPVELEPNQRVDAFDFDGWWVGYIVKKSDVETRFSSRRYVVRFPDSNLDIEFERSRLRLHQDWDGVKWVADAGFASQDLEGSNSVGDKVVQAGDVAEQKNAVNAAMEISTSPDSRDEAKGNSLESSKWVTRDEHKSLLPQKKSKKEATEGISSPTAFQEVTSGGETLREMLSQYQISDSPNIQVGLRGKMLAHRRNPSLIYSRTKQRRARTEDLKVRKNREVRKPHKVTKPEEQLGNVGDEQLNEKLLAPQTEPVTPVCLWNKDLQTQERTSVIRLKEISNEASQSKGDEIIHEEQQKSPHQSSHNKVTKPEEQLGNVRDEQLNDKLHAPQTEPVTPIGLWDKDLQTQERTSVIRLEEISNDVTQDKGDEIVHEENQKSPHQSSGDHDEQRNVKKANAVNPSCKELSPLPFVKRSPMWNMMESNVVFNTIPQSPHFQPLEQCSEVFREGMAIGHMLAFANVADAICKLHLGDHRSAFENMLKDLAELERHGFNGQLLQVRIERLLWLKDSILQSEDKLVEADMQIRGQQRQKDYLNTEIDTINRDIAILQEKRASVIETRKKTEENIERLQQDVQKVKEASRLAEEDFKKVAATPWSAFHP